MSVPDGHEFALCLTHDVDRPHKSVYQALYYAVVDRRPDHLRSIVGPDDPYWQFEDVMALEDALGVRSAFYFLNEPNVLTATSPRGWLSPTNWIQHLGRYDVRSPDLVDVIGQLDDGGWEVGLHGSSHSYADRERLAHEKRVLEDVLGHPVRGGRQHYLRIRIPRTWEYQADVGLDYDASLGSGTEFGFQYGYGPLRPFGDEFVVFPLTLMEQTLPDPDASFGAAWTVCRDLLEEAAANGAVMTVLWHPRFFSPREFPGYRRLYRRLVEYALDAGAWVGPPVELYDWLDHDATTAEETPRGEPVEAAVDGDDRPSR